MKYGFVIDNRKCIGCHACTTACKSEHQVPVGVNRTWGKQVEKGIFPDTRRLFSVMRCNHCTEAPCVEICPVEALFVREDGIVDFDKNRCIGCKSCMQACPYDALYIDPDTHTAAKCNYCAHRIDIGLEPACVNVCPEEAIISGDMDNPESGISKLLARQQTENAVRTLCQGLDELAVASRDPQTALQLVAQMRVGKRRERRERFRGRRLREPEFVEPFQPRAPYLLLAPLDRLHVDAIEVFEAVRRGARQLADPRVVVAKRLP